MANQHRDCSLPYTSESKECRYMGQMSEVGGGGAALSYVLLSSLS